MLHFACNWQKDKGQGSLEENDLWGVVSNSESVKFSQEKRLLYSNRTSRVPLRLC